MSSVSENLGLYADFGSDSEDEEWERKQIEKKYQEIREFVRCHPMSLPDDEDGDAFWHKVIDRMKEKEGVNGMLIFSFVRFDIMKKCMKSSRTKKSSLIAVRNSTVMENSML